MSERQRIRAEANFVRGGRHTRVRAQVPSAIKNCFGANKGDTLVFEEGCDKAVMLAALSPDGYFVVRIKRATEQVEHEPRADDGLEPFAAAVNRFTEARQS